jgi:hypothetical protein
MAISSVKASLQAEDEGGAAGSAGFSASAGPGLAAAGACRWISGASAGRGFGNGTDAGNTV